jgi:cytochrome c553
MNQQYTWIPGYSRDRMTEIKAVVAIILLSFSISLVVGCESCEVPSDAPDGHTTMKDCTAHKPGLKDPTTNCVACHGVTLEGGAADEPSCFSCHGREW